MTAQSLQAPPHPTDWERNGRLTGVPDGLVGPGTSRDNLNVRP